MSGQLFVVATPIGNLADFTFRAVETLKQVSLIACEDTRQTRKLLDHYGIATPLISYHEHNEQERAAQLVERLRQGDDLAIVSDAGTPLISDPGYRMVKAAVEAGFRVVPIPGACAAVTALSASGMATDSFRFGGFLPRKTTERRRLLETINSDTGLTLVFYESPHRVLESLQDIDEVLGNPPVVAAREVTKIHEELLRGSAREVHSSLLSRKQILGEFTLVIGKREPATSLSSSPEEEVARLIQAGMDRMDAIKAVAKKAGLPKRELYQRLKAD